MEYKTVIFEESQKKVIVEWLIIAGIILLVSTLLILRIMDLPGIGGVSMFAIGYWLFKTKNQTYKEMGINSYGDKKAQVIITEKSIQIRDQIIPFAELKDLTIYVDEYYRMPKQFFGQFHGGNNEIRFTHNGSPYSFNYWIKSKSDFEYVEKLVSKIEKTYPPIST